MDKIKSNSVKIMGIFAVLLSLLLISACTTNTNTNNPPPNNNPPSDNTPPPNNNPSTLTVVMAKSSVLGNILTDNNGMTLYMFRADTNGTSTCYGQCATFWPPLLIAAGVTPQGQGVSAALGVTQRTDGTYQVTANGLPLYYFANDNAAGDVNGQGSSGSGALWLALDETGKEVTKAVPANPEDIVKTGNTELGNVLVGPNGMALYDFRADTNGVSTCYDECAYFWPPLLVKDGLQPTGENTTATLGVTQRTDGSYQVTANGLPLYYYAPDSKPKDIKGQGSTGGGALWYLLDETGKEITNALPISSEQSVMKKDTGLGEILVGNNGMTLYMFQADSNRTSTCYGQCAYAWPPLLINEGLMPIGENVTSSLNITKRTDGTYQVTANGMPLYYYFKDSVPGDTLGQGVTGAGDLWYVVSSSGRIIKSNGEVSESFSFFITSQGLGKGADLGGLIGADNHCQNLAASIDAGSKTWKAYLSTTGDESVNARDRIGNGPWYNIEGVLIASNINNLHSANSISKETALSEKGEIISGRGDTPNTHDILTGSDMQGRAIVSVNDTTCQNWASSADGVGSAMLGHHDRMGLSDDAASKSWVESHLSRGCSQENLRSTGGDGLFYCFATD